MKKFISILFISVYLSSFQEFRQVFKLPNLVEHIVKHRIENGEFSLVNFLNHHYFSGNVMDNDYAQDQKLPFKQIDFTQFSTIVFVVESLSDLKTENPKRLFTENKNFFISKHDFISEFQYSIFQPPEILM